MSNQASLSLPVLLAMLCAAGAARGSAQNSRLSGEMVLGAGGRVDQLQVSADGLRAVFEDVRIDGTRLYAVATDGSLPAVELAQHVGRSDAGITPDHAYCVFTTAETGGLRTLRMVPVDGGPGSAIVTDWIEDFRLSGDATHAIYRRSDWALFSIALGGGQTPVEITAPNHNVLHRNYYLSSGDGQHVVYSTTSGLYVVPVNGSQAPLELRFSTEQAIEEIELSPDGQRVLFSQSASAATRGLHSVPIDGSRPAVKLNPAGSVIKHALTSDGARVVFLHSLDGQWQLYGVPIDRSSPPLRLDALPDEFRSVVDFRIDPQGLRVVYIANQEDHSKYEVYSVPVGGGQAPVKLNGAFVEGGSIELNFGTGEAFAITSPGTRVLYVADQEADEVFELFSAPIDGSASAVKLSGPMAPGGGLYPVQDQPEPPFLSSADGARVVYVADQHENGMYEIFSVPVDGSAPAVRVSDALPTGGDVGIDLELAAGGKLLFVGDQDLDNHRELFVVPFDASSPPQQLNAPFPPGQPVGDVVRFRLTPDERSAIYLADQEIDGVLGLYRAPVDGSSAPFSLTPQGTTLTQVSEFAITPDGARAVYTRGAAINSGTKLYSAPIDGSLAQIRLDDLDGSALLTFEVGGARVVYAPGNPRQKLFSVPSDGSQPAQLLDVPTATSSIVSFAFSPDATRVVFLADEEVDERLELFSVPSDGSQVPIKLNAPLAPSGDVRSFAISPDSTWVVFLADLLADERLELFATPLAGGATVRLSKALVTGGDVGSFRIAPDSVGVVYLADGDTDEVHELYAVPFATPQAYRLNDPLVSGGDVSDFVLSANSQRVVFRADAEVDQRFELFSVRIDRALAPTKLSGTPGANVLAGYSIDSESRFVVYLAKPTGANTNDLFRAQLDGTAGPRPLTRSTLETSIFEHQISPDGRWVTFLGFSEGHQTLFRVRPNGSDLPMALVPRLARFGHVQSGTWALSRGRVLYLADQRKNKVTELFSSVLVSPALPQRP